MRSMFAGVAVVCAAGVASAAPIPINFTNIENNSAFNAMSVIDVTVDSVSTTGAVFRFARTGTHTAAITQIYIDDNASLFTTSRSFVGSAGTAYSVTAGNLPGGNAQGFSADWGIGSIPPPTHNAVNANGEWVDITLTLATGKTYANVLSAINSGSFRLGMHIQSLPNQSGPEEASDAYISTNVVPLPPAVWSAAGGLLLAGGAVAVRKRQRR